MRINLRLIGCGEGLLASVLSAWAFIHGDSLERACAIGVLMIAGVLLSAVAHAPALCASQLRAVSELVNVPRRVIMYKRLALLPLGLLMLSLSQGVMPSLVVIVLVMSASALYASIYFVEKALEIARRDIGHSCQHCAYPLRVTARCSECGTLAPAFVHVR